MSELTSRVHDWLSSRALLPLTRIQRTIRPARRTHMLAYYEGLRFRRQSARWDEAKKREWVLGRLRFSVRRAYDETVYYRRLLRSIKFDPWSDFSFEDFSRIPVLEREDVHEAGMKLVTDYLPREQLQKDATGGSTGTPTEIWLGPEEIGWRDSAGEHFKTLVGAPEGTRTGLLWGHHLDPVASDRLRDRYYAFATNIRWFDCFRLSPEVLDNYHREFERWRPRCIVAYASALGSLAEHVKEQGYRPNYPTRCFVTGAEKLLPHHREIIEEVFNRPVHERYGSRDAGYVALQLDPRRSLDYYVDWSNIIVEPETCDAESDILITKLHADAMPMLRYRIGDIGHFSEASRPGHPSFTLREVVGRATDRIWLPDGRWINGIEMPHLLKDFPVREFNLVQRSDYSIELNIIPKDGFGESCRKSILATLAANLQGLSVNIRLVEDIPRTKANKWRPVMTEVNRQPGKVV